MGYLEMVRGNILNVAAGILTLGHGAEVTQVNIPAFGLADAALINAQLRAFHEKYAGQPYMRFEQKPDGYWVPKEMGASKEALENIPVAVVPGEPIPLSQVFKVVPTREEYEARFDGFEVAVRKLLLADDNPAVYIDYSEAAAVAASVGCRLPTREERMYAALAGRQGDNICGVGGDGILRADNAHWSGPDHPRTEKQATAKVRSYEPTPWGHYDLAGNTYDWVALQGVLQGISGGSWYDYGPDFLLAAGCRRGGPGDCYNDVGARLARSVSQHSRKGVTSFKPESWISRNPGERLRESQSIFLVC